MGSLQKRLADLNRALEESDAIQKQQVNRGGGRGQGSRSVGGMVLYCARAFGGVVL